MSNWAEIKYSLNGTLGSHEFEALNNIFERQIYNMASMIALDSHDLDDNSIVVIPYGETEIRANDFADLKGELITCFIPSTVKKIGANAFYDFVLLTNVILPNNSIEIGEHAFSNTSIKSVNIRNATPKEDPSFGLVSTIEYGAFEDCGWLESVFLPKNIYAVSDGAFKNCTHIKKAYLPNTMDYAKENSLKNYFKYVTDMKLYCSDGELTINTGYWVD